MATEIDAAHDRARSAYAQRDLAGYMQVFSPALEYQQSDGRTVGRESLARSVGSQFERMSRAETSFTRESLDVSENGDAAVELLEQRATFEVSAFIVLHRSWNIVRRGRYWWARAADGWYITRVHVLAEDVLPARMWIGFE